MPIITRSAAQLREFKGVTFERLAEVYSLRGERLAAEEALSRAEERLANSTDKLWAWVARIRQKVGIDKII